MINLVLLPIMKQMPHLVQKNMIIVGISLQFVNLVTGQQQYSIPVGSRTHLCPLCRSDQIALIPLSMDEEYCYTIKPDRGLDIEFMIRNVNQNR